MKKNIGIVDRSLRYGLGVFLIWLGLFSGLDVFQAPGVAYAVAAIGLIALLVASVRFCPLYAMLGVKTCREC